MAKNMPKVFSLDKEILIWYLKLQIDKRRRYFMGILDCRDINNHAPLRLLIFGIIATKS